MAYGAIRYGDAAPLPEFLREGTAGGPSAGDYIHGELLDQFCLYLGRDTVVLLLPLSLIHQRQSAFLMESAGKSGRMGWGQLKSLGNLPR